MASALVAAGNFKLRGPVWATDAAKLISSWLLRTVVPEAVESSVSVSVVEFPWATSF